MEKLFNFDRWYLFSALLFGKSTFETYVDILLGRNRGFEVYLQNGGDAFLFLKDENQQLIYPVTTNIKTKYALHPLSYSRNFNLSFELFVIKHYIFKLKIYLNIYF